MFKELKNDWKNQNSSNLPSHKEIMAGIYKNRNALRRNLIFGIIALSATIVFGAILWFVIPFNFWTTQVAFLIMALAIISGIAQFINLTQLLPNRVNGTKPNSAFAKEWKSYHQMAQQFSKSFIKWYMILLSLGLGFYMYEITAGNTTFRIVAYATTTAWILYAYFILTPRVNKQSNKKIQDIISAYEKIEKQYE